MKSSIGLMTVLLQTIYLIVHKKEIQRLNFCPKQTELKGK